MKISVITCTCLRPVSLARTLGSIARAEPPRAPWEMILVDNGGDSETTRTIDSFRDRLPIVAVRETTRGVSRARNAGVAAATGDYILWTDDDVTVGPTWMRTYEDAFIRYPDAAFFGGPIRPRFEGTPPRWLPPVLPLVRSAYAGLDVARDETPLGANIYMLPYGANMAIRGPEQRTFRYDVTLGRQPATFLVNGEESDLLRRIVAAGGTGVWLPSASVEHWISPERQSPEYLRRYYAGLGFVIRRTAILAGQQRGLRKTVGGYARLAWHDGVYTAGRLAGRPQVWVGALKKAARIRGALLADRTTGAAGPVVTR